MTSITFPSYVLSSTHPEFRVSSVAGKKSLISFVVSVSILKKVEAETKHDNSKYLRLKASVYKLLGKVRS
jgi:hypothetical protein